MGRLFFRLMLAGLVYASIGMAWAQDSVTLRSGVHPSYSRLVLDWNGPPSYDLIQQDTLLILNFQKPATADLAALGGRDMPNIKDVKVLSAAGENLKLSLTIPKGARVRHFATGERVVVDVYNTEETKALSATRDTPPAEKPVEPAAKAAETKTAAAPATPAPEKEKTQVPAPAPANVAVAEPAPAVQAPSVEEAGELAPPALEPHVITITSTNALGMAVFERAGTLWMVIDNPEMTVPPQISGPQRDMIPQPVRVDIQGGVAYHMPMPQGMHVYGEGGGLLWRIVLSPNEKNKNPAKLEQQFAEGTTLRGGTLLWSLTGVRKTMTFDDPIMGDKVDVVTVSDSAQFSGPAKNYIEMRTLPSWIGMAYIPKVDDLETRTVGEGVAITRPGGLSLSRPRDVKAIELRQQANTPIYEQKEETEGADEPKMSRIYHFDRWEMGGLKALDENQTVLMAGMGSKDENGKIEDLMTLAKLTLANDRGYEALGYLKVAGDALPEIQNNTEYKALRGAANALAGKYDEAIEDFSDPLVSEYGETGYWKAYTLAGLEDWQQAAEIMPEDFDVLVSYPLQLSQPLALVMAEISLRSGKISLAEGLLGMLEGNIETMPLPYSSAWRYLMGEDQRQRGNKDKAKEYWEPQINGKDDLYRAKAGLSLTRLQLEENNITPAQAIDRLEGLRYVWRGDELETLINYRLGQVYINNGEYLKGLSVLRNAVSLQPGSKMSEEVANYMTSSFRDLFMSEGMKKISPLDAVTIYEEFKELTPAGEDGDKFIEMLAERLVEADLLGRAATLLDHQVTHRLEGAEKARVAVRLAAVRLLDNKPEGALRALTVAEETMKQPPAEGQPAIEPNPGREREIKLLRARAYSKLKKPEQAMEILATMDNDPIVARLRSDVAWNAGDWEAAADAFQDLILADNISLTRPLTPYQTNLILNRSIALNLSGNRVALANMRERYDDAMKQTEKAQLFDVVTRPRQLGLMGSRENVTSLISEVDMFKEFLDTYRKIDAGNDKGNSN
jgi:tetratricopeptide (TPR) repeat protein